MSETRRRFVALLGLAPIAALLTSRDAFAQGKACSTPDALSLSERSMRRSVEFVDPAPDPAKHCGSCAFFIEAQNGCGKCQIMSGGWVPASAHCASFAPRAK